MSNISSFRFGNSASFTVVHFLLFRVLCRVVGFSFCVVVAPHGVRADEVHAEEVVEELLQAGEDFYRGPIIAYTEISRCCDFLLFRVLRRAISVFGTNDDFVWLLCRILKKLDLLVMSGRVFLLLDTF